MKYFASLITTYLLTTPLFGIEFDPKPQLRRPISLSWVDANQLAIGNQLGSISIVNLADQKVVDEIVVADRIADLHAINDQTIAVLDESRHALVIVSHQAGSWSESGRIAISHTPVTLAFNPRGTTATVASLWSQRLTVIDFRIPTNPQIIRTINLPFAPRIQKHLNDREVLVAGAFGGHLAIVNFKTGTVVRHRELNASHNLSGLALVDETTARVPHLMLNHEQATTGSNVHWGDVMSNVVRSVDLNWFRSQAAEETTAADLYYLGHPDDATGDPTGICITKDQRQIIAFAGINQVGISDVGANTYRRIPVGRRPGAFILDQDQRLLYVANRFDDSLSIVDVTRRREISRISLGPKRDLSLIEQGEILFFDSTLSSDGWFSCHSCHTDGHSNGQLSDTFGDNYQGSPKRVMTLRGTSHTAPWAWNGKVKSLEDQIRKSIETTMRGEAPTPAQTAALTAYVRTLPAAPSIASARRELNHVTIARGRQVFESLGCVDCHATNHYTSPQVYDVGLEDSAGNRDFNPPSLLGVSQRPRLLHHRRAKSYREALQIHPYGEPVELDAEQWQELTQFLNSL
ncbi:MAG: cytochrome c peroxidase [Pirellulaceae bacterium]|nr:cytochrome c peroxidase [Pirellulaceae bacterium]